MRTTATPLLGRLLCRGRRTEQHHGLLRQSPAILLSALMCLGVSSVAIAGNGQAATDGQRSRATSLLDAWLGMPDLGRVDWNFSFIRTPRTEHERRHQRKAILQELQRLADLDHLPASRKAQFLAWRQAVESLRGFRVPGRWGPADLLAQPEQAPPLSALSSFGYCEPARTVEVWDETGVHRLPWEQAASVAALVDRGALVLSSDAEWITVIQPWGKRKRVGVAAWNAGRSRLVAGARVVAPSHLKGTTPTWLNKALPDFLAHVVAGRECRTFTPPGA